MIRSYSTTLSFANSAKKKILQDFLFEYRSAVQLCIDFFWNTSFKIKNQTYYIKADQVKLPMYLDYKLVNYSGKLSARAFNSACDQSLFILKSQLKQREQLLFVIDQYKSNNRDCSYLEKKLSALKFTKPEIKENFVARLSSKCIDFQDGNHFDKFIRLKCTGFDHIKLPIKFHKKMKLSWDLLGEVRISKDDIWLSFETPTPEIKSKGKKVGVDTGVKTTVTFSDKQITRSDPYGHNLDTITDKLARKKKGSKAYKKAQDHRKNYINWSINQINFSDIKEIGLEDINTFNGKRSRKLSSFAHRLIKNKLENVAEELGVLVSLQSCTYRSQRCSGCSFVCKSNRNGKIYSCKNCGIKIDSDFNASMNHEINLPEIPFSFTALKLNKKGFFWKEEGLFDFNGQELRVPDTNKEKDI